MGREGGVFREGRRGVNIKEKVTGVARPFGMACSMTPATY